MYNYFKIENKPQESPNETAQLLHPLVRTAHEGAEKAVDHPPDQKQKFILKNGRKTYCSNCYEPATATSENEGYSNCCGKHIITAGETLECVNRDLANLSK